MTPEMNPTYNFTRPDADFIRKEVMIPMRDGAKLFTVIAMKKGAKNAPDPADPHALQCRPRHRAHAAASASSTSCR